MSGWSAVGSLEFSGRKASARLCLVGVFVNNTVASSYTTDKKKISSYWPELGVILFIQVRARVRVVAVRATRKRMTLPVTNSFQGHLSLSLVIIKFLLTALLTHGFKNSISRYPFGGHISLFKPLEGGGPLHRNSANSPPGSRGKTC